MAFNYYEDARSIARDLEAEGFTNEAQVLEDDIDTASVSTQMLMALRYHMRRDIDLADLSGPLRTRMKAFIEAANALLG